MQVKPSNNEPPSTISRELIVKRLKAAAVVSSSDEPSSSGDDTDTCALPFADDSLPVTRSAEFEGLHAMIQKAQSDLSLIEKEISLVKKRKLRLTLHVKKRKKPSATLSRPSKQQKWFV